MWVSARRCQAERPGSSAAVTCEVSIVRRASFPAARAVPRSRHAPHVGGGHRRRVAAVPAGGQPDAARACRRARPPHSIPAHALDQRVRRRRASATASSVTARRCGQSLLCSCAQRGTRPASAAAGARRRGRVGLGLSSATLVTTRNPSRVGWGRPLDPPVVPTPGRGERDASPPSSNRRRWFRRLGLAVSPTRRACLSHLIGGDRAARPGP
jgi:hypothetical protein